MLGSGNAVAEGSRRAVLVAALAMSTVFGFPPAQADGTLHMAAYGAPEILGLRGNGHAFSSSGSLSADGRFAVFRTDSNNLADGDTGRRNDIYLSDRKSPDLLRISRRPDGGEPNADSWTAAISADGRWVVYASDATDIVAASVQSSSIYLFDRLDASTRLLTPCMENCRSVGSYAPAISADGSVVVFRSSAQLLPQDDDFHDDVYAWLRASGSLQLLSVDAAGQPLPGTVGRHGVAISADARHVSFTMEGLGADPADSGWFVRDLAEQTLTRVSGVPVDSLGWSFAFSADGRYLAFDTDSPLQAVDTNTHADIYLLDRRSSMFELISAAIDAGASNGYSSSVSLSADAGRVCFSSWATNLVAEVRSAGEVYCRDRQAQVTRLVSTLADGSLPQPGSACCLLAPSVSADGSRLALAASRDGMDAHDDNRRDDVFVFDLAGSARFCASCARTGPRLAGGRGGHSVLPRSRGFPLGDSGRLLFASNSDNLTPERAAGVFFNDIASRNTVSLIRDPLPSTLFLLDTTLAGATADGEKFLVRRNPQGVAANDINPVPEQPFDLWLFDSFGYRKRRIDEPALVGENARTIDAAMSDDGEHIVFLSDRGSGFLPPQRRLFLQRSPGEVIRIDTGPGGVAGDIAVQGRIGLSRNGRFVAFATQANNLVPGDTDSSLDLYLRDLSSNTLTRLRHPQTGAPLVSAVEAEPSRTLISDDGQRIAFENPRASGAWRDHTVLLLDRREQRLRDLCPAAPAVATFCGMAGMSADGATLVFTAGMDLLAQDTNGLSDVYRLDMHTGELSLQSIDADGRAGDGPSHSPQLSASGNTLVFRTDSTRWRTLPQISGDEDYVLKQWQAADGVFADGFEAPAR